jgi:acyl-CoA synthetase (NDP forming)
MSHRLESFFKPKTIAVVGASKNTTKIGHAALKNILISDYECKVYPINPHETEILGVKCYKKITDIKADLDLALISVPAKIVPQIMHDCVKKNVKNVIIISSGFSEVGNQKLEDELEEIMITFFTFFLTQSCII